MYVSELHDGLLIKPTGNWEWSVHPLGSGGKGREALEEQGVFYHSSVRFSAANKDKSQDPAVYLGKKVLAEHYYGLKTHHIILLHGVTAAIDGYSFKDLEKI